MSTVEEMFAMRELMTALGSPNMDCREPHSALDPALGRSSYIFNSTIDGIEKAGALMLVGTNPRLEASVLNARIRKRWRTGEMPVAAIGEIMDLTYEHHLVGFGVEKLEELAGHKKAKAKNPMMIVGAGAFAGKGAAAAMKAAAAAAQALGVVTDEWNGFNVLHTAAARVGGLDLGFVPREGGKATADMLAETPFLFLLGADELNLSQRPAGAFTVYIGSHGDVGAHHADVILPGATYTEKSGTFVNTEGRVQMAWRAAFAPGEAREDWAILRALSESLGHKLPFDSLAGLRDALYVAHPHFAETDEIARPEGDDGVAALAKRAGGKASNAPFRSPVTDFYMTNPIARASAVMAECSARVSGDLPMAAE